MKKKDSPLEAVPDYNGAAVYALESTSGKLYIGSTQNLQKRIEQHRVQMRICAETGHSGYLNSKIEACIHSGERFKCKILAQINPSDLLQKELVELERVFLRHFGGTDNTLNEMNIRHKL